MRSLILFYFLFLNYLKNVQLTTKANLLKRIIKHKNSFITSLNLRLGQWLLQVSRILERLSRMPCQKLCNGFDRKLYNGFDRKHRDICVKKFNFQGKKCGFQGYIWLLPCEFRLSLNYYLVFGITHVYFPPTGNKSSGTCPLFSHKRLTSKSVCTSTARKMREFTL